MKIKFELIETTDNKKEDQLNEEWNIETIFKESKSKEKVLCVGKVQSGKTKKILKCIDYAFENENYDIIILFAGTNITLYNQTEKRLDNTKKPGIKYLSRNSIKNSRYISSKKYVISILKNNKGLDDVNDFLYSIKNLDSMKVLIIDDESDYASINISKDTESNTYKKINELYNNICNGKLLQVTATPFANIMSRKSMDLYPDRIVCWSNYTEYKGISEFDKYKEDIYEIIEANKYDLKNSKKYVNQTIEYFLSTIINNFDLFEKMNEITCLFNVDDEILSHLIIYEYIKKHLISIMQFKDKFYKKSINKEIKFEEFNKKFNYVLKQHSIILFNQLNENDYDKKKFNIYIGGIKASRGYTFENMITELILNSPKNKISVDTLLQRCRWFGDRSEIMPFMKIFMNINIHESLSEAKKYVEILEVGEHKKNTLYNKIATLDLESEFVCSTSKE